MAKRQSCDCVRKRGWVQCTYAYIRAQLHASSRLWRQDTHTHIHTAWLAGDYCRLLVILAAAGYCWRDAVRAEHAKQMQFQGRSSPELWCRKNWLRKWKTTVGLHHVLIDWIDSDRFECIVQRSWKTTADEIYTRTYLITVDLQHSYCFSAFRAEMHTRKFIDISFNHLGNKRKRQEAESIKCIFISYCKSRPKFADGKTLSVGAATNCAKRISRWGDVTVTTKLRQSAVLRHQGAASACIEICIHNTAHVKRGNT